MKRFYKPVDLRSRTEMTDFLQNHFRYNTMNSWNNSTSYACNLKVYRLGLTSEIENKLYDMVCVQGFFDALKPLTDAFAEAHNYRWQAGMNGRSGGYLVLYQGETKLSQYKSYCTCCGQRNYRIALDGDNTCGVCRQPSRINYQKPPKEILVYPGRGTDYGEDFEDWSIDELRERVRLVQELDQLGDAMVDRAVWLANNYTVEEEEYFEPRTGKVLVGT